MTRLILPRFFTSLLVMLTVATVQADDTSAQQRIGQLEQRVQELEQRLQQLEEKFEQGVPMNKALVVEAMPGGWRNAANWAQLADGMDRYEVARFLGEPERIKSVSKFDYWMYGDGKATLYMNRLKSWDVPSQAAE
jgi:hypothetical protein